MIGTFNKTHQKRCPIMAEIIAYIEPNVMSTEPLEASNEHMMSLHLDEKKQEKLIQDAYQKGYDEGFFEGVKKMKPEKASFEQSYQDNMLKIAEQTAETLNHAVKKIQDLLIPLFLNITEQLYLNLFQSKENLQHYLETLISKCMTKDNITLLLHPQDIAWIQQGKIQLDNKHFQHIRLKEDTSLSLGGLKILLPKGWIDASINTQLNQLKQKLLELRNSMS